MRTIAIAGAWYCDNTPEGAYVAAKFGGGVLTHGGPLPAKNLQWVRISPDGVRFAGTDATDPIAWEWTDYGWQDRGAFVAPRAVIYQGDGSLKVERAGGWPGPGSQGWRYVDDNASLVPAWSTYADAGRAIYEYTTRRDVTIGQGQDGGVDALVAGKRIRLDRLFSLDLSPLCFAVNFSRKGDQYAVSWYVAHSPTDYTSCLLWLTDSELRALPDVGTNLPIPEPTPEPDPMPIPDQTATVAAVRNKYPTPLGRFHAACLMEIAQTIGRDAGLLRKTGGTVITLPGGQTVAQDIIAFPDGTAYDCLGSGETLAIPQWGEIEPVDPSRYYKVSHIPDPEPDPEPEPPAGSQMDRIESKLDRLLSVYRV